MPIPVLYKVEGIGNDMWRFCANQTKNKWQDIEDMEKNLWQSLSRNVFFPGLKRLTDFTIKLIVYCFASIKSKNNNLFLHLRTFQNFWKIMEIQWRKIIYVIFNLIENFFLPSWKTKILTINIVDVHERFLWYSFQINWMINEGWGNFIIIIIFFISYPLVSVVVSQISWNSHEVISRHIQITFLKFQTHRIYQSCKLHQPGRSP